MENQINKLDNKMYEFWLDDSKRGKVKRWGLIIFFIVLMVGVLLMDAHLNRAEQNEVARIDYELYPALQDCEEQGAADCHIEYQEEDGLVVAGEVVGNYDPSKMDTQKAYHYCEEHHYSHEFCQNPEMEFNRL